MSWGVANAAMLLGLLGMAIPVIIHLLSRRQAVTIDWGAMQFLELGRRARRRLHLAELLLMTGRMLLLGLVALALARPFWKPDDVSAGVAGGLSSGDGRRDVVLILDGSSSMGRQAGGTSPRARAIAWARQFVRQLKAGDSVAVLVAKDRILPWVAPPSYDLAKMDAALAHLPAARGSSDLPAAVAEAFRLLETTQNPARDVVVLSDGQRFAWRPGEPGRWALLRDLHRRLAVPPRLWAVAFGVGAPVEGADGSVGPLELARGLVAPHLPITVRTTVANAGPGPLTRTAELLVDGVPVPGSAQVVGPIPAGSRAPLLFKTTLAAPGSHALAVRLAPSDDPQPGDDEAARPVEVTAALPVLLVNGEPGLEPLSHETDFLRIALAPTGDDTPQVRATVITADELNAGRLEAQRVLVLANVERLDPGQVAAVTDFLSHGGGVLIAPGDRTDADFANQTLFQDGNGWLPARLGAWKGDPVGREAVAHPAPRSFVGPSLAPLGQGDAPALGQVDLFGYQVLEPSLREPKAVVTARLDTNDPWIVERSFRKGRVALLAGPIDAEGGTLPVNPDFVPWAHELIFHLADPTANAGPIRPGEPLVFPLDPPPPARVETLPLRTPGGAMVRAAVRRSGDKAEARYDDTSEPGLYRLTRPAPVGGFAYAAVAADAREADLAPLEPAEATKLAEGWPLAFETDPARLSGVLLASGRAGPRPLWRLLILAALVGLCLEVWLTRRLVRSRGMVADPS